MKRKERKHEEPAKKRRKLLVSSTSSTSLSVTDSGAIKVTRPKKSSRNKSTKRKSSAVRSSKRGTTSKNTTSLPICPKPDTQKKQEEEAKSTIQDDDSMDDGSACMPWPKSCFQSSDRRNLISIAIDEIALEGLDGITIEALWMRLCMALNQHTLLTRQLQKYIWKTVRRDEAIKFYLLKKERGSLLIPGEDDYGEEPLSEIYPYVAVNDARAGVMGSCSTYSQRKLFSVSRFSLKKAEQFHNRLIMVGTQELRNQALFSPYAGPLYSFPDQQYCILEKIGRSRRRGETTIGPGSLTSVVKDSRTLFYYHNGLQLMNLTTKQACRMRTDRKTNSTAGLLHLERFYMEIKSKRQLLIEHVIKLIKEKPQCRMEYMELKRILGVELWERFFIAKLIKSQEFRQFVKTQNVLYRQMYPDASRKEWKHKAKDTEKSVRVLQLQNHHLNINSIFKEDAEEAIVNIDGDDSEEEEFTSFNELAARRVYNAIYNAGPNGITLRRLATQARCDYHCVRNICKILRQRSLVDQTLQDCKRQHYMVFVANLHKLKPKPARSIKPPVISSDDADALSFIADILNVEVDCLRQTNNAIVLKSKNTKGIFMNKLQGGYFTAGNANYSSQNEFVEFPTNEVSLVPNQGGIPKCIALQFDDEYVSFAIVDTESDDNELGNNISNDGVELIKEYSYEDFEFPLRKRVKLCSKVIRRVRKKKVCSLSTRTLTSFEPFRVLLSKYKFKSPKTYLNMLEKFDYDASLSASDDGDHEDACSSNTVISGFDNYDKYPVGVDVKDTLIKVFEESEVCLQDEFKTSGVIPKNAIAQAIENKLTKENFFNADMELFMGPTPRVILVVKDLQDVDTMLVASAVPAAFGDQRPVVSESQRTKSRIAIVKDCVDNQKLISDIFKVQAIINQTEKAKGYNSKIDRRSMHRIFTTLVRQGALIVVKIILRYQDVVRTKNMVAAPGVDIESLTQSYVEQFKNSFVIYAKRKIFEGTSITTKAPTIARRRFKYSRFIGRTYGFNPKISKMRILHEFLFYLICGYNGIPVHRQYARDIFLRYCGTETIDGVMEEATTLFHNEASWRMFIPPLPVHKDWPTGWALISDVLLRLPVSLFVKVFNVSYIIPELPMYLNHPIRRHFIVKNLPSDIKDALLGYRKYIFSVYEVFCYLAYMGLLQFGPQKMREKDQIFFYFNRNAILFDTSDSLPGYHHVSRREYPKLKYNFQSVADIEKYWADMYMFAMSTKLGHRLTVIGQTIKLEYVHSKSILSTALKAQTPESALQNDVGYLPGDGLGACCADSALWLHVNRNWFWCKTTKSGTSNLHTITGIRRKHLDEVRQMKMSDLQINRRSKKFKIIGTPRFTAATGLKKSKVKLIRLDYNKKKQTVILRKVKPRKTCKKARIRIDQIDRSIIDGMGKSRAAFTLDEDRLVLICVSCCEYLTELNKKRFVSSTVVRDFVHCILPDSKKTSFAYRRRGVWLRKANNFEEKKDVLNYELASDFFTEKHFRKVRMGMRPNQTKTISDSHLNLSFLYLAYFTYQRTKGHFIFVEPMGNVPDFLSDNNAHDCESEEILEDIFARDPRSEEDVSMDTIQSVIHSSLGGQVNNQEWPFRLLRVYQSFPEEMLRIALLRLREYQLISGRKMKSGQENTILMSGITYNLSFSYVFKQITQFPHCVFVEGHQIFVTIQKLFDVLKSEGLSIQRFEQGHGLGVAEYQTRKLVDYEFQLPENVISLNPQMKDFTELIEELARRYKELMRQSPVGEEHNDIEVMKQMEATLQSFMNNEASQEMDEDDEFPLDEDDELKDSGDADHNAEGRATAPPTSEFAIFSKADRRHRSWKISDMAFMLTKGLFPELDDDDRLEKLNEHFIVRHPTCRMKISDDIEEDDAMFSEWHEQIIEESHKVIKTIEDDALIQSIVDMEDLDDEEWEIVEFLYHKGSLGATSMDLKAAFSNLNSAILFKLIEDGIVLRVGIARFHFVHHNYRHIWTICLEPDNNASFNSDDGIRVLITPWIRINGTVHIEVLEKWMSIILSYCLSFPVVMFTRLCSRFNMVKPIDIYYLLELLQRLKCIKIMRHENKDSGKSIFNDFQIVEQVPANMLDNFDYMFVEVELSAIVKFGAFINREQTDFYCSFEEDELNTSIHL